MPRENQRGVVMEKLENGGHIFGLVLETGLSESTVRRHVKALVAEGLAKASRTASGIWYELV